MLPGQCEQLAATLLYGFQSPSSELSSEILSVEKQQIRRLDTDIDECLLLSICISSYVMYVAVQCVRIVYWDDMHLHLYIQVNTAFILA